MYERFKCSERLAGWHVSAVTKAISGRGASKAKTSHSK